MFGRGRRFRRGPSLAAVVCAALVLAAGARWLAVSLGSSPTDRAGILAEGPCELVEVLVGPVLVVCQQAPADSPSATLSPSATMIECRVRLIGLEALEDKDFAAGDAPRPEEFLRLLARGKSLSLRFDKRRVDREGRSLAYVYADDILLNESLLEAGLARIRHYPGDSAALARRLKSAEAKARSAERGLWGRQLVAAAAPK